MQNPNDLDRPHFASVNDEIAAHAPESQGFVCKVAAKMAPLWCSGDIVARSEWGHFEDHAASDKGASCSQVVKLQGGDPCPGARVREGEGIRTPPNSSETGTASSQEKFICIQGKPVL